MMFTILKQRTHRPIPLCKNIQTREPANYSPAYLDPSRVDENYLRRTASLPARLCSNGGLSEASRRETRLRKPPNRRGDRVQGVSSSRSVSRALPGLAHDLPTLA